MRNEILKTPSPLLIRLVSTTLVITLACAVGQTLPAQTMPEVMPELANKVQSSPEHDARMAWFREAKYGLFIHWGLYAIPAGVWKGKAIRPSSEWIMAHAQIPVAEYEKLAGEFNPVGFDAEHWVQMAQDAGMKYIVITAKHGDGFAMYHSAASPYNIYDATPFHRDPCKELADACARHGLKLGFYYSQSVDWHEPGGEGNSWDFGRDDAKNKRRRVRPLPANQGGAAGQGTADRLRPGVRVVLRHARDDHARARPAHRRRGPRGAARLPDRRAPGRAGGLRHDGRQRHSRRQRGRRLGNARRAEPQLGLRPERQRLQVTQPGARHHSSTWRARAATTCSTWGRRRRA